VTLLSRVIYGARVSLYVAVTSIGVAMVAGGALGLLAGYNGGLWDNVIKPRDGRVLQHPGVAAGRGRGGHAGAGRAQRRRGHRPIVYTPLFARVMRGPVLAEREKEYIEAVHALGASRWVVALKHLLPTCCRRSWCRAPSPSRRPSFIRGLAELPRAVGAAAHGRRGANMLNEGRTYLETAPWISVFPGVAIMTAVLAFNLIGDGLRDILDPTA